jgi:hypothetical protein
MFRLRVRESAYGQYKVVHEGEAFESCAGALRRGPDGALELLRMAAQEHSMGTNDINVGSACPGIKALTRAQTDLATAAQSCENAIKTLAPAGGGQPRGPDLAFLSGMFSVTLAGLDIAGEMLADLHGDPFEQFAEAACDA